MKVEPKQYYVTRGLNTVFAEVQLADGRTKMINTDYMQKHRWFSAYQEGNYFLDKTKSHKDIIQKLEDKTSTNDLYILDLFQLADYTLSRIYKTAKDKNENVYIYNSEKSEIKIYHGSTDKVFNYPVISVVGATHTENKIYRLNNALGRYK